MLTNLLSILIRDIEERYPNTYDKYIIYCTEEAKNNLLFEMNAICVDGKSISDEDLPSLMILGKSIKFATGSYHKNMKVVPDMVDELNFRAYIMNLHKINQ